MCIPAFPQLTEVTNNNLIKWRPRCWITIHARLRTWIMRIPRLGSIYSDTMSNTKISSIKCVRLAIVPDDDLKKIIKDRNHMYDTCTYSVFWGGDGGQRPGPTWKPADLASSLNIVNLFFVFLFFVFCLIIISRWPELEHLSWHYTLLKVQPSK